jgi:hypothetical protein
MFDSFQDFESGMFLCAPAAREVIGANEGHSLAAYRHRVIWEIQFRARAPWPREL